MSVNTYDVGDRPRLTARFYDAADALADPTTVTFRIRRGQDTAVEYVYGTDAEVVKAATGTYYVDYDITLEGSWAYRAEGTGAVKAAAEGAFVARQSAFYP